MTNIKSDFELDAVCRDYAEYALDNVKNHNMDLLDAIHEIVDGSEHVIFHYYSKSICFHCNTDNGEMFLEDIGMPSNPTYDTLGDQIAYGEIHARTMKFAQELMSQETD